jgi:hypothetical protein
MVPVRGAVTVFAVKENATVPEPVPVPPEVMLMNPALLVADQPQPAGPITLKDPDPAAEPPLADVEDSAKLQPVVQPMSFRMPMVIGPGL